MRVSRGKASVSGDITIDSDLDFLTTWQVKRLSSPASGEALRKGNRDIGTAEISLTANILATQIANTALTRALMTAQGDLITRSGTIPKKLVKGTAGQYLKQGANEPEWAAIPSPLTVGEAVVFDDTSPTSWTDLDLSGTVGVNAALVVLRIIGKDSGNPPERCAFRKNGDSTEYHNTSADGLHCANVECENSTIAAAVVIVATDSTGKIEWISETAEGAVITLIAYIK